MAHNRYRGPREGTIIVYCLCPTESKAPCPLETESMQKSLDQNARVDIIQHAPELTKAGGIGALLRY